MHSQRIGLLTMLLPLALLSTPQKASAQCGEVNEMLSASTPHSTLKVGITIRRQ